MDEENTRESKDKGGSSPGNIEINTSRWKSSVQEEGLINPQKEVEERGKEMAISISKQANREKGEAIAREEKENKLLPFQSVERQDERGSFLPRTERDNVQKEKKGEVKALLAGRKKLKSLPGSAIKREEEDEKEL